MWYLETKPQNLKRDDINKYFLRKKYDFSNKNLKNGLYFNEAGFEDQLDLNRRSDKIKVIQDEISSQKCNFRMIFKTKTIKTSSNYQLDLEGKEVLDKDISR